jgi:hypothetical protein
MEPASAETAAPPAKARMRWLIEQRDSGQGDHSEQNHSGRYCLFGLIHFDFS